MEVKLTGCSLLLISFTSNIFLSAKIFLLGVLIVGVCVGKNSGVGIGVVVGNS